MHSGAQFQKDTAHRGRKIWQQTGKALWWERKLYTQEAERDQKVELGYKNLMF